MKLVRYAFEFVVAVAVGVALVGLPASRAQAEITHRYSFGDGKADDSVGKVHGKLKGFAQVADGQLKLENLGRTSGNADVSYVEFSERLLPKSGSVTIEVWFNSRTDGNFGRLFDFGQRGEGYVFMTVDEGDGGVGRAAITDNDVGEESTLRTGGRINDQKPHMAAFVIDANAKMIRLYIDGKQQGNGEPLGDHTLEKVRGANHWIGRSIFDSDAGFTGTIDELRIFNTALKPAEIEAHFKAGPDKLADGDAKKADAEKK